MAEPLAYEFKIDNWLGWFESASLSQRPYMKQAITESARLITAGWYQII